MTALLYGLGADLEVRDKEHQCTTLGWAAYFGQAELAELVIRFGEKSRLRPLAVKCDL